MPTLPALVALYYHSMQYTLRNVPAELDEALRARARRTGKSRVEDPEVDKALTDQRAIDERMWG